MSSNPIINVEESPLVAPVTNFHLAARNPQQMAEAQANLALWFQHKAELCFTEVHELTAAVHEAKVNNWKSATLVNQLSRAKLRELFYRKCLAAVKAGFTLVPNIPVDVFAIRVTRENPTAPPATYEGKSDASWNRPTVKDEKPDLRAEVGDGNYVSPSQRVSESHTTRKDEKNEIVHTREQWATDFDEVEFPVIAASPIVMKATQEAMLHRIFDEIGVSPQNQRTGDPLIIGHVLGSTSNWRPKTASFLIAWHVDLRTL